MEISSLHSFFREKIQKKNSANAKGKEKKKLKEINNWGCSQELNYTTDKGTKICRYDIHQPLSECLHNDDSWQNRV